MRDEFGLWGLMRAVEAGDRVKGARPGAIYDGWLGVVNRVEPMGDDRGEGAVAVWVDFPIGMVVVSPRDLRRLPEPAPRAPIYPPRIWWLDFVIRWFQRLRAWGK